MRILDRLAFIPGLVSVQSHKGRPSLLLSGKRILSLNEGEMYGVQWAGEKSEAGTLTVRERQLTHYP